MPVKHQINNELQLIITAVTDEAVDEELINAITAYQKEIKIKSDYATYNELVDFSKLTKIELTTEGIKQIAQIASTTDQADVKTKLALIVKSPIAFGLARMYQTYRSLNPGANKELRVFNNSQDAFEWVERDHFPVSEPQKR